MIAVGFFRAATLVASTTGVALRASPAGARAIDVYVADLSRLDSTLVALATRAGHRDTAETIASFLETRRAYKRVEWLAEHYTPLTAAALNGPALPRPDDENPRLVVWPTGLQVVEATLYAPSGGAPVLDSVAIQARIARVNVKRLRERIGETAVTDAQLFDAARAQIARIVSLGIAGFDTPLAATAISEAGESIRAVAAALAGYGAATTTAAEFQRRAAAAAGYTESHTDFVAFDRFEFIVHYANPLARALATLERGAKVARLSDTRAWAATSATLFDRGAFEPQAFAPPGARRSSPDVVSLGARLFDETRLSGRGDRSCATCHARDRAFTDGRRFPVLLPQSHTRTSAPRRNTPTLINAALQAAAFSDARVAFLEDQISAVVSDPREMGGNVDSAAALLLGDTTYRAAITRAFGGAPDAPAAGRELRGALAAYLRSLVRLDSRFDRAMRGEEGQMTPAEIRGFNLFMGKGRCGTCHFAPLFNGTVPPGYTDSEVEVLGVPANAGARPRLDSDLGVGARDLSPLHAGAFKTRTVRNAAVTAPYMHNGVYATLAEVVDFYDAGGGAGLGLRVPNQTLPTDSLHLTPREKRDLIAFISTLTDRR